MTYVAWPSTTNTKLTCRPPQLHKEMSELEALVESKVSLSLSPFVRLHSDSGFRSRYTARYFVSTSCTRADH